MTNFKTADKFGTTMPEGSNIRMAKADWVLNLEDKEWPLATIDHDRIIVRVIVVDDEENYYFVRENRDEEKRGRLLD